MSIGYIDFFVSVRYYLYIKGGLSVSIISNVFRGLSSKTSKEQTEKANVDRIMSHIRYKEELVARVHNAELVNKIIDEIIAFVHSSEGERCIRNLDGIIITINQIQYSYHECSCSSSDSPLCYHRGTYEECGYKDIKDLAFLEEFGNYARQRVKDTINESYIVSELTHSRIQYKEGESHRYWFTIKQPKVTKQALKDW